jgi:hypothetical protein
MEQPISVQPLQTAETITASVEIFDPPLCCPTGLCGPTLDQTLLDVNEMILSLESKGFHVKRYQMASDPNAFLGNENIMRLIRERQLSALPITLVKGEIIKVSEYPSLVEVENQLNENMA